jgi:aspartokinase-like uncharacterized kinase
MWSGVRCRAPGAKLVSVTRSISVIKIGGSLARTGAAAQLLRALAAHKLRDLIVVPGGGEFADTVRLAQPRQGLSDHAAHHMALLAMQIMAVAMADAAPDFALAESKSQFEAAWQDEKTPIWVPAPMVLAARDIPGSWDVTSDSLAAWLAGEMGAARLLLVKSGALPAGPHTAEGLTEAGVVDAFFARYVSRQDCSWTVVTGVDAALAALIE